MVLEGAGNNGPGYSGKALDPRLESRPGQHLRTLKRRSHLLFLSCSVSSTPWALVHSFIQQTPLRRHTPAGRGSGHRLAKSPCSARSKQDSCLAHSAASLTYAPCILAPVPTEASAPLCPLPSHRPWGGPLGEGRGWTPLLHEAAVCRGLQSLVSGPWGPRALVKRQGHRGLEDGGREEEDLPGPAWRGPVCEGVGRGPEDRLSLQAGRGWKSGSRHQSAEKTIGPRPAAWSSALRPLRTH